MEICRKRSGNDRRTRALRKIFEPLHEMRSSRAPRPRARSLCVVSSSPHVRQSGERSNQWQSRDARVGKVGRLPRATLAVDLVRCAHHETAFVDPQWLAELLITSPSPGPVITRLGLRVTHKCYFSVTRGAGRATVPQHAREVSWKQHSSISKCIARSR